MLKIKFGKQATKIEAWGLPQLGVYKNLANLLVSNIKIVQEEEVND